MGLILLIVLIVLLLGGLPTWPHSRSWGYGPSGGLGLLLVIVVILLVLGYIPRGFWMGGTFPAAADPTRIPNCRPILATAEIGGSCRVGFAAHEPKSPSPP